MQKVNAVFDIGKVLIGWHPVLGEVFGTDTAKELEEAIFVSGYWDELDLGVEPDVAIFEKMIALAPGHRKEIMYVMEHLDIVAEQKTYAKSWIHELKGKGYGVYFLSNYSRHLRATQPQLTDFTPLTDGGIFSSDVKLVKPDHRIYEMLLKQYELEPGNCLFIDDRQDNVEAAIECGMRAIRFDSYEENYEEIMKQLEEMRDAI